MLLLKVLFVCVTLFNLSTSVEVERRFTVIIDAQKKDCFYEEIKKNHYLEVSYEVVSSDVAGYGIDFQLEGPSGQSLVSLSDKDHHIFREVVQEEGIYTVCLDNRRSAFASRSVFLEIFTYPDDDDEGGDDDFDDLKKDAQEEFDGQIEEFKRSIGKVHSDLTKVRQIQEMLRAFEARDRNLAEQNFFRVNMWSGIHLMVMVSTGIMQVFLVRVLLKV